jgi:hypothetical protein
MGSVMGLLAILMIAFAPTVSRIIATHTDATDHAMPCDMPSMHHDMPASSDSSHSARLDADACAYCSLLAHMPVLGSPPVVFALVVKVITARVAVRFDSVMLLKPTEPGLPRAPPSLSS